ncbi:MAG: hypothetical protein E7527_06915 [Ruminococcaceae bacterium]|nr:hypothetical protein [Oscillospiraceae bacterium]
MKRILLFLTFCYLLFVCGCTSNSTDSTGSRTYDAGFEDGRNEGYSEGYEEGHFDGYEDGLEKGINYEEADNPLSSAVISLMYDHEYETVKLLLDYERKEVQEALLNEFGTSDVEEIIKQDSKNIIGNCEICSKSIYKDQLTEELNSGFAHYRCVHKDEKHKVKSSKANIE